MSKILSCGQSLSSNLNSYRGFQLKKTKRLNAKLDGKIFTLWLSDKKSNFLDEKKKMDQMNGHDYDITS